jgi:hypothetical protein
MVGERGAGGGEGVGMWSKRGRIRASSKADIC